MSVNVQKLIIVTVQNASAILKTLFQFFQLFKMFGVCVFGSLDDHIQIGSDVIHLFERKAQIFRTIVFPHLMNRHISDKSRRLHFQKFRTFADNSPFVITEKYIFSYCSFQKYHFLSVFSIFIIYRGLRGISP